MKQVKGVYKVKDKNLLGLYKQVKELRSQFDRVEIEHINRENNKQADKLSKNAVRLNVI